ncbi:MAG: malonyl-CoA decarboxylase [Gammaproteobacteria bacterium]|nr:malonyl-CoA decarboxylase [Gammaproteobacteria bacterium]
MTDETSLLGRTFRRLRKAWSEISSTLLGRDEFAFSPDLTDADLQTLQQLIERSLKAPAGEVSARALAAQIGESYIGLDTTGRERFLRLIATGFDVDEDAIEHLIDAYPQAKHNDDLRVHRKELRNALVPPRIKLLTLFNTLPEGFKFLVDMRSELLVLGARNDPELSVVESDLMDLLTSWFDIGFLRLEHITWESPAALLEKLIEYEAVHEISSWTDLKHRLAPDRRLYAFFHPNMPGEPLIFVQVALVKGLATNIQSLLDTNAPVMGSQEEDTAIFYSISNAQQGLAGISFGNFLIKRVVADLGLTLPQITQFSTLSPIPGFVDWLQKQDVYASDDLVASELLTRHEAEAIQEAASSLKVAASPQGLMAIASWWISEKIVAALKKPLTRLCIQYLNSYRVNTTRILDPVAHFHLSNGATLYQINWMADVSEKGISSAAGMMINYLYDPDSIDQNTQNYAEQGTVTMSNAIKVLLEA